MKKLLIGAVLTSMAASPAMAGDGIGGTTGVGVDVQLGLGNISQSVNVISGSIENGAINDDMGNFSIAPVMSGAIISQAALLVPIPPQPFALGALSFTTATFGNHLTLDDLELKNEGNYLEEVYVDIDVFSFDISP